tara:strand:+ start:50590 stop:51345 length:756 start_codon:yes stop_codon:yes gene_type:complete
MKAYLDNNVIIDIEKGLKSLDKIIEKINGDINEVYYSSAHIQELEEIKGETPEIKEKRTIKRLNTIGQTTKNRYLYEDMNNQVYYQIESPRSVMETLQEVPGTNEIMKDLMSLISREQKHQTRELLGIESKKLNNYAPSEVVGHLSKKLSQFGTEISFLDMINTGIESHPEGSSFGYSHKFAAIFEVLDMLGYWKDKETNKSNYARLWDSNHSYFACFCNYFVTDDLRTIKKSKVLYDLYGVKTEIVNSKY